MTHLQQVKIGETIILVEVSELASNALAADTAGGDNRFENVSAVSALVNVDIGQMLTAMLAPVHQSLKAMKPDEVNVELTLGFGVKGDLFVAKGEGNAALKVSAKWKFDSTS